MDLPKFEDQKVFQNFLAHGKILTEDGYFGHDSPFCCPLSLT